MAVAQHDNGVAVASGSYTAANTVGGLVNGIAVNTINTGGARDLLVFINVASLGTSTTLTVAINGYDPGSKTFYNILTSAALGSAGFQVLRIGPNIASVANVTALDYLPEQVQIVATPSNANASSYSIGYSFGG